MEDMKEIVIRGLLDLMTGEEKVLTMIDTGEAADINYFKYLSTYLLHMYIVFETRLR